MMEKVLIIDDSAWRRGQIRDLFLNNKLAECWESREGIEAVEKYRMLKPYLVIVRILDMLGVEIVKRIRAINPDARILILSDSGNESYVGEAMRAGALEYLIEPVTPENLLASAIRMIK
ncbi:MAG: response regulator [bacterium]